MNSNKRKVFAVLSAFALFSPLSFADKITNSNLNKKILSEDAIAQNTKTKPIMQINSENNSILRWKIIAGIFGMGTMFGMGGMYKQHNGYEKRIEDNKKAYDVTLNGIQKAFDAAKKNIEKQNEIIAERDKTIEAMKPHSSAFSLLKLKYSFVHQLHHGRQGSTAVFEDKDNKLFVVKTLFKSGTEIDLDEVQREKTAVENLKGMPKNDHIVLPIECFEDVNFLFVVYPYVPWAEKAINHNAPYLLSGFKKVITDFKQEFDKWGENEKKKFLWNITKQFFEVYKYFYENKFCHNDLGPNVLVQLKKTENLHYDDFTIKIIDWGRWIKTANRWKIKTSNRHPYQPMVDSFGGSFENIENNFLYNLYDLMNIKPIEHFNNSGNICDEEDKQCSQHAFFFELDRFFGLDGGGCCESLPNYFVSGKNGPDGDWVYAPWVKIFKFAQSFDDLINFCQKQIDDLK